MRHWFRSYLLLLRWSAIRLRFLLPLVMVIQIFLSVGIVIGFAFLLPQVDPATARYLSTGAPTLGLITIGMVMAPQLVATAKTEGTFAYNQTLPVPRTAVLGADVTVWLVVGAPGLILGLLVAALRFDFTLHPSWAAGPAMLLVALTATTIGFAIAYATTPAVTNMVTQLIVFIALMFSPINFPADRLPGWLQAIHQVLPFQYMAEAVRDALTSPPDGVAARPFLVLTAWCAAGLAVTLRVMTRRA
ncbi:ABC transporter permease [Amorphoplanes digitatis]|uniref:ABC-2 type transport system permease protein n=1 Tax=Actinoplanes digitatis TaxID=1868 RepID=A0A7W7MRB5_9ACTN|nr:ABC transporter permease [Actinoplanes digitatis]MBB4764076.1 ABC-2 type transport system permease protein [Actinoplanes digitatis]GID97354.1 multidrug ABC transporter permease [Actinoplanes digitatis]